MFAFTLLAAVRKHLLLEARPSCRDNLTRLLCECVLVVIDKSYGRAVGLGRGLGVVVGLGVSVAVAIGVGVGVSVAVAVAVAIGVAVGVAVGVGLGHIPETVIV